MGLVVGVTGATAVGAALVDSAVRADSDAAVCGGGSNGAGKCEIGCVTVGVDDSRVVTTTGVIAVPSARFNVAMVAPAPRMSPISAMAASARDRCRVDSPVAGPLAGIGSFERGVGNAEFAAVRVWSRNHAGAGMNTGTPPSSAAGVSIRLRSSSHTPQDSMWRATRLRIRTVN